MTTATLLSRLATLSTTSLVDAGPALRRRMGLAFVPEDRNGRGSVPEMSLAQNALLTAHPLGMVQRGLVARASVWAFAQRCIEEMGVRCGGAGAEARSLSGGNLQKFIIGREIRLKPKILIASQPTWGVDVGAAAAIRPAGNANTRQKRSCILRKASLYRYFCTRPSSSGQDGALSRRKPGFDSPWAYQFPRSSFLPDTAFRVVVVRRLCRS